MEVVCKITFQGILRAGQLSPVIGILAGLQTEWAGTGSSRFVAVPGATEVQRGKEVEILLSGDMVDGSKFHSFLLRNKPRTFDFWDSAVCVKSIPFWCATAKRLVDWFGGVVVYSSGVYPAGKNRYQSKRNCPTARFDSLPTEEDRSWQKYQRVLGALAPITPKELLVAEKVSGIQK